MKAGFLEKDSGLSGRTGLVTRQRFDNETIKDYGAKIDGTQMK